MPILTHIKLCSVTQLSSEHMTHTFAIHRELCYVVPTDTACHSSAQVLDCSVDIAVLLLYPVFCSFRNIMVTEEK